MTSRLLFWCSFSAVAVAMVEGVNRIIKTQVCGLFISGYHSSLTGATNNPIIKNNIFRNVLFYLWAGLLSKFDICTKYGYKRTEIFNSRSGSFAPVSGVELGIEIVLNACEGSFFS